MHRYQRIGTSLIAGKNRTLLRLHFARKIEVGTLLAQQRRLWQALTCPSPSTMVFASSSVSTPALASALAYAWLPCERYKQYPIRNCYAQQKQGHPAVQTAMHYCLPG